MHFRIADEILKHLHQIDREYFIIGNIAPDCGKRVENGYDPPTEVTHLTKMWNKSDCNCEFIFENCIKDETEFKKKSCLQNSPPATGRFSDIIPLRRSAILPGGLFYVIGTLRSNFL